MIDGACSISVVDEDELDIALLQIDSTEEYAHRFRKYSAEYGAKTGWWAAVHD